MPEKVKRLTPKPETLRQLYLFSGNVCAFKACNTVMVSKDGTMVGEICHIEAAEENGPRFNSSKTNEQRRSYENLMLMCPTHHARVDKKPNTYTVAALKKLKTAHEAPFAEINETLQKRFENQFSDHTDALSATYPATFKAINKSGEAEIPKEYLAEAKKDLRNYINKLQNLPDKERAFMLSVIRRAVKLDRTHNGPNLFTDDVESAFKIGSTTVNTMMRALERHGLGDLSQTSNDEWKVRINDPCDIVPWSSIAAFAEAKSIPLEKFVMDLQFQLLD